MCNLDSKGHTHEYKMFSPRNNYTKTLSYEISGPMIGTGRGMYTRYR